MPETTSSSGDGPQDGVQVDLISTERMNGKTSMEKIRLILDSVREGDIVVLESGLTPTRSRSSSKSR